MGIHRVRSEGRRERRRLLEDAAELFSDWEDRPPPGTEH